MILKNRQRKALKLNDIDENGLNGLERGGKKCSEVRIKNRKTVYNELYNKKLLEDLLIKYDINTICDLYNVSRYVLKQILNEFNINRDFRYKGGLKK